MKTPSLWILRSWKKKKLILIFLYKLIQLILYCHVTSNCLLLIKIITTYCQMISDLSWTRPMNSNTTLSHRFKLTSINQISTLKIIRTTSTQWSFSTSTGTRTRPVWRRWFKCKRTLWNQRRKTKLDPKTSLRDLLAIIEILSSLTRR